MATRVSLHDVGPLRCPLVDQKGGRDLSCCHTQLADFLTARVERAGGMMALPDVYCLFNRARGTELISPDDLLQVAAQPQSLPSVPVSQVTPMAPLRAAKCCLRPLPPKLNS